MVDMASVAEVDSVPQPSNLFERTRQLLSESVANIVQMMASFYVLMPLCVNKIFFDLPLEPFSTKYAVCPDAFVFWSPASSASGRLCTIKTKDRMATNITSIVSVLVMSLFSLSRELLLIILEELDPISLLHFCKV
jgi:hypothetical protein